MPAAEPPFDVPLAHRYFASDCFNLAWTFIDRADRRPEDDEAMLLAATASLWHWSQRADCTNENLSIGHWQASRASALAGHGENALRHALRSLDFAAGLSPFYQGYAYEALARAAGRVGDASQYEQALLAARSLLPEITDEGDRIALENDLATLTPPSPTPRS
jgi:hypothetical protein